MDINIDKRANRIVIYCVGSLNAESAPELEKKVEPLLSDEKVPIILDFTGVNYISSAGVRILLFLFKKVINIEQKQKNTFSMQNSTGEYSTGSKKDIGFDWTDKGFH